MEDQIVQNVKQKFKKLRDSIKNQKGFKKNNILPLIGIPKPKQQTSSSRSKIKV